MSENLLRESAERVLRRLRNHTYTAHDLDLAEQIAAWHRTFEVPDWPARFCDAADALEAAGELFIAGSFRDLAVSLQELPPDVAAVVGRALSGGKS